MSLYDKCMLFKIKYNKIRSIFASNENVFRKFKYINSYLHISQCMESLVAEC